MTIQAVSTASSLEIYYLRWQALDHLIDAAYNNYNQQAAFPRKATILQLLRSLRQFASGQFQFFYFGLDADNSKRLAKDPLLAPTDKNPYPAYPPADVLTGILEQISNDLELIQKAADQRILGNDETRQTLKTADKLAWLAIKPAIDYSAVDESTTILTYFQKSAAFYRIPYAQVALIGIPFTCSSPDCRRDFLAIPHEAGHYVYRHLVGEAQDKLKDLRAASLAKHSDEYKGWIKAVFEETFADVYGALIAGPVMAADFESLSLANNKADFIDGDGEHANPALRPLIYCQVLQHASVVVKRLFRRSKQQAPKDLDEQLTAYKQWTRLGQEISDNWYALLKTLETPDFGIKTSHDTDSGMKHVTEVVRRQITANANGPVFEVVTQITEGILTNILAYGQRHRPGSVQSDWYGWAGPRTAVARADKLLDEFAGNFDNLLASVKLLPPEADPTSVDTSAPDKDQHVNPLWVSWVQQENPEQFDPAQGGHWPPTEEIEAGRVKNPGEEDEHGTWGYILYGRGWTTEGPDGDPGHPFLGRR